MTDLAQTRDDDTLAVGSDNDTITGSSDDFIVHHPIREPISTVTNQTAVDAFTINTTEAVGNPKVLSKADGTLFAAYVTRDGDGNFLIKGQSFDASGQKIGDEVTFDMDGSVGFVVDKFDFDIDISPNGQVVVSAYVSNPASDDSPDRLTTAVFEFNDSAEPILQSQQDVPVFNETSDLDQVITSTDDGSQAFFVERDSAGRMVVKQKIDEDGEVTINTVANFNRNDDAELDATTLVSGRTVMILDRNGDDSGGDGRILFKVFGSDGQEVRSGNTGDSNANTHDVTVTAMKNSGILGLDLLFTGFVVAWTEEDGFDSDVQFQLFGSTGFPIGPVKTVGDSGGVDNNNEPTIVALDDGGFIIFYDDDNGANSGINGQRYDFAGQEVGDVFRISNEGFRPDATLTEDNQVAVSYVTNDRELKVEIIQFELNEVFGTVGSDELTGTSAGDLMRGFEGNDILTGLDGDDEIHGGDGDDVLIGGSGDDLFFGGAGSDTFVFSDGDGNNEIRGFNATNDAEKIDLTRVSAITDFTDLVQNRMTQVGDDVLIDLGGGNSLLLKSVDRDDLNASDFLLRFASINGTENDETLTGTENADVIRGLEGDDVIIGGRGDDLLFGGAGSDIFVFADGAGNDEVRGFNATNDAEKIDISGISAAGATDFDALLRDHMQQVGDDVVIDFGSGDTITLRSVQLDDLDVKDFVFRGQTIVGTEADDVLAGGDGDDQINGLAGNDEIDAGDGDDDVTGGLGRDTVFLGDGNDVFRDTEQDGPNGTDTVSGGTGDDTFHGAGGDDVFDGGTGNDLFFAGSGDETFVFADGFGNDTIVDFGADDVLDLSAVSSIESLSELTDDHIRQDGENLIIDDLAGNTITLEGINILDLSGDNFLF